MERLFLIGNGFDAYMHDLPTRYSDFREYVITKYSITDNYSLLPDSTTMPDGEENYNESEVSAYICQTIDSCGGADWNELESYLGRKVFNILEEEFV